MTLGFHPLALHELDEAVAFFELQQKGLGITLLEEAERRFQALQAFPQRFARIYKQYRRFPLDRYPYSVIYGIEEDLIYIVALAHQARRPDYWHDRIE